MPAINRSTEVLMVSDIHLGSPVSRSKELLEFLKQWTFKKLILNGDVFDNLNIKRFRVDDWNLLDYFRELAKRPEIEFVWLSGDHEGDTKNFATLVGFPVQHEHYFTVGGKKCLATHGDHFDGLMKNTRTMRILGTIAGEVYLFFQRIDVDKQRFPRWIKRTSKWIFRVSQGVARGAIKYGKAKNVDYVFCGHTHLEYHVQDGSISYWNSGCWTDIPSNYVTIDSDKVFVGEVQ